MNLASFVTTFMEEEAEKLMAENISKNFIDYEEVRKKEMHALLRDMYLFSKLIIMSQCSTLNQPRFA